MDTKDFGVQGLVNSGVPYVSIDGLMQLLTGLKKECTGDQREFIELFMVLLDQIKDSMLATSDRADLERLKKSGVKTFDA